MRIVISGASGFIGTYLSNYFKLKGHEVIPLTRKMFADDGKQLLAETLAQSNVVINLAGASINHRWSKAYKQKLYDSRINVTNKIVEAINTLSENKPQLLISTSAVGYYPSQGCYSEYNSINGTGFLSQLSAQWEAAAKQLQPDTRLAITRFGVVLSSKGGAFEKIVRPVKLGVATIIGNGKQYFPWISIEDLANAMNFIIDNATLKDVVNFVAPEIISNKELTKKVAKKYRSFFTIKLPKALFRLLMGEASEFITEGQCVTPTKLTESGFEFKTPSILQFLEEL